MRRSLLLLAFLVSACDTGGPEDPSDLVGTWEAVSSTGETYATSNVDQSVPDFTARGEGGIDLSGAVTDRLRYASSVHRRDGYQSIYLSSASDPREDESHIIVVLTDGPNPSDALLNVVTPPRQDHFQGRFPDGTPSASYASGQLTVPSVVLQAEDGSGREVTLGGQLVFPLVVLKAGEEARIGTHTRAVAGRPLDQHTLVFGEDGTYTSSANPESPPGRWRLDGPDGLVLRSGAYATRYTYAIEGNALRLTSAFPDACVLECVPSVAAGVFADPGSFASVRSVTVDAFQRVAR